MAMDWQVVVIGCGALVMAVITSLRSSTGTAPEQSGSRALGLKSRSGQDGTEVS